MMNKKRHNFRLATKLNFLAVNSILLISAGLVLISYLVESRQVDRILFSQVERVAGSVKEILNPDDLEFFIEIMNSEEFQTVREEAVRLNDPELIGTWLDEQPGIHTCFHRLTMITDSEKRTSI